jgi:hypothetical protein
VAKRGRPLGTGGPTHWSRNAANVAAQYASVLIELWLADAPVIQVQALLRPLSEHPEHRTTIEECWKRRGTERRHTVPKAIKRNLCQLAIAYATERQQQRQAAKAQIEASLQRSVSAAEAELHDRGWTDRDIGAWLNKLSERARKRGKKDFRTPNVDKVFEIVTRHAPAGTLRRKAGGQVDDRELAYRQYDEDVRKAWREG